MTEVMEREPLRMAPTIVRRVVPGALEVMERPVEGEDGRRMALCVFWSAEHARREMYAKGCFPEDGWAAVELNPDQLALVFELLNFLGEGGPRMGYIEPAPGASELCALVDPAEFVEALREGAFEAPMEEAPEGKAGEENPCG